MIFVLVANTFGLNLLTDFIVNQIGLNPSDHLPVSVNFMLHQMIDYNIRKITSSDILTTAGETKLARPKRINSIVVDWNGYKVTATLELSRLENDVVLLQENPSLKSLDYIIDKMSSILHNTATTFTPNQITEANYPISDHSNEFITNANTAQSNYLRNISEFNVWDSMRLTAVTNISKKPF